MDEIIWGTLQGNYPGGPLAPSLSLDESQIMVAPTRSNPPTDVFAFYLPYHCFSQDWWGIYLTLDGLYFISRLLFHGAQGALSWKESKFAAKHFLYFHEVFHHKTECFATKLELVERAPLYIDAINTYYWQQHHDSLEEGLANGWAILNTGKKTNQNPNIWNELHSFVAKQTGGYQRGINYLTTPLMSNGIYDLSEQYYRACFPAKKKINCETWGSTNKMFDPISNINSKIKYLVPHSSNIRLRSNMRLMPTPRRLIKKLKKQVGLTLLRNGGNHDILPPKTNGQNFKGELKYENP